MGTHKNSPKRIIIPGAVYYIVIKTHNNYPYFKEEIFCDLFIENLKICKQIKGFKLYGFSVIYDHINLLIQPNEKFEISQAMKSLKENFSRNANIVMGYTIKQNSPVHVGTPDLQNLSSHVSDTTSCRLRGAQMVAPASKRKDFGKNYDKINIDYYRREFIQKYGVNSSYLKFKWLKSFYDHIIRFHDNTVRQEKDWDYHYDYTVYNHIKHGLPENWKYTSLNYPELIDSIEQ